jgi:hypothetical protein
MKPQIHTDNLPVFICVHLRFQMPLNLFTTLRKIVMFLNAKERSEPSLREGFPTQATGLPPNREAALTRSACGRHHLKGVSAEGRRVFP